MKLNLSSDPGSSVRELVAGSTAGGQTGGTHRQAKSQHSAMRQVPGELYIGIQEGSAGKCDEPQPREGGKLPRRGSH